MNVVQTNNNYKLALLDLSQLIELETPEGFLLENPAATIELIPLASPDEIYQLALGCKASIQAAQYRLEGSKHSIRIAQKRLLSATDSQRESRYELLFDNQPHFQPTNE